MNGILIPQNIFVGDSAQFLLMLSEQEIYELTTRKIDFTVPLPLKNIAQNEAMTIHEIRIVERDNAHYLLITFVPWETGDIAFPSLSFLPLKRVIPSVHVSSLLENMQTMSLQPPKPPLLIPGTDYLLYGLAAGGIGLCLLLGIGLSLVLHRFGRKRVVHTSKRRLNVLRRKLRQLYKEARRIHNKIQGIDAHDENAPIYGKTIAAIAQWYTALDHCVRNYLCSLFTAEDLIKAEEVKRYFTGATYTEIIAKLAILFNANPGIADLFVIFYTMLEKQRFGTGGSGLLRDYSAVADDMLKKLPYIADKTEAEYANIIRKRKEAEMTIQETDSVRANAL